MTDAIARCLGTKDGNACTELPTCHEPVPLCTPHRMQVALAIVPQMLKDAAEAADVTVSSVVARQPSTAALLGSLAPGTARIVRTARRATATLWSSHEPQVYFIRHGSRVKIGFTRNLGKRLNALSLRATEVIAVLDGDRDLERALHRYFGPFRIGTTEWFQDAQAIRTYVRNRPGPAKARLAPAGSDETPLTALIRELVGDDNGFHLQDLRPAMRKHLPGMANATDEELRQVVIDAGFNPSRKFRARGIAGRIGVHRDDIVGRNAVDA
ncbi:GIY-YIG nuclease family protein [Streptomyces sp. NPDC001698]|uniref:GIY-YIG nuclease family protein n=1 Tax=Streptomyces sp. NPDC001698 TaxID=3364601 RepID=UPI0036D14425